MNPIYGLEEINIVKHINAFLNVTGHTLEMNMVYTYMFYMASIWYMFQLDMLRFTMYYLKATTMNIACSEKARALGSNKVYVNALFVLFHVFLLQIVYITFYESWTFTIWLLILINSTVILNDMTDSGHLTNDLNNMTHFSFVNLVIIWYLSNDLAHDSIVD